MKTFVLLLFVFLLCSNVMIAEENFQAIPLEVAPKYDFNLAKNLYANQQWYEKDLAEAQKLAEDLQAYKGKVTSSGPLLYELSQKYEHLNLLSQRLFIYAYLSYAINTREEAKLSAADRATSDIAAKIAFINTELRQVSEADIQRLEQQEPKLKLYHFFLVQNARYKSHTLSADQEQLLAQLSPQLYSWQSQAFQKLIDRTKFTEMKTDSGTFQVYRDRSVLSKDKDRNVRKDAMLKLYDEYDASADLYGFLLIKQADALNSTSKIRGFKDAFDASLFDSYLTKDQADAFFTEIAKFAPLMQRYIKDRKDHIKATSGLDSVEPWDMDVVPSNYERPRFNIQQTSDILKKALGFHGERYSADLANLLDPANGRLDIVKGENRIPGAFAWGHYGNPFVFYSFAYQGYEDDVLTLAHEGGHVVHYDLIWQNKVPPVYADGPSYFTESFAMFNEFVTADYLYKNATTKDDKIYYLEQWLSVAMRRFFDIVMRSEFEYRAYEKMLALQITEPEQIHQLWKHEGLQYVGEDYQKHDFLKYGWTFTPHFFNSPRYYINYMVANLMAINYYQKHLNDPNFDRHYVDLMQNGFPDTPLNLLQKYVNLNPFDPAAVKDSMKIFEGKLAELESLYK